VFERILYLVSEKQEEKSFVMNLARQHQSTVFLAGLIASERRQDGHSEGETRVRALREERERKCWHDLYHLEEELKSSGIQSSVIAQQGNIDTIQLLASNTRCNLIVLSASSLLEHDYKLPEELLPNLPCPLIITQSS
jgi:hypothetical protein